APGPGAWLHAVQLLLRYVGRAPRRRPPGHRTAGAGRGAGAAERAERPPGGGPRGRPGVLRRLPAGAAADGGGGPGPGRPGAGRRLRGFRVPARAGAGADGAGPARRLRAGVTGRPSGGVAYVLQCWSWRVYRSVTSATTRRKCSIASRVANAS